MRILLDTHVAIWISGASLRVPPDLRALIGDPENTVFVSVATLWEMAIKSTLGKRNNLPFSRPRR